MTWITLKWSKKVVVSVISDLLGVFGTILGTLMGVVGISIIGLLIFMFIDDD
jgi:hypothetical protein